MIKLERIYTPIFLSPTEEARLANEFKTTGDAVWKDKRITSALLDLSNSKCAYCECDLSTESKYMEVEHFAYKEKYPEKVAQWDNLLPSCKRCNTTKGQHDVVADPIVNPFEDFPCVHLEFFLYQIRPKTKVGEATETALNLNHHERLVLLRFKVGEQVQSFANEAIGRLESFKEESTSLRRNKLLARVEGLLFECQPSKPYSATAATVLHSYKPYMKLRVDLQALGIWNDELESFHKASLAICLAA